MANVSLKLHTNRGYQERTVFGESFYIRGFHIVAHKDISGRYWSASEYYTGMNAIPDYKTYKTKKAVLERVKEVFESLTEEQAIMLHNKIVELIEERPSL